MNLKKLPQSDRIAAYKARQHRQGFPAKTGKILPKLPEPVREQPKQKRLALPAVVLRQLFWLE